MKRKRNQIEETSHDNKKFRLYESTEQINNNFDSSFENKKEDFILTQEIAENEILSDISGNKWRIGVPVGKGSFGEIFLASNDISRPVNCENSSFVTKIEPHSNGKIFLSLK